jgi:hypothetical protein
MWIVKVFALAVLLTIMQTSPPVPRKAADNSAQTTAEVRTKSQPGQAYSAPAPTSAKADGNRPAKSNSDEQHAEDTQHTVGISKLPPVSVMKDWADWGIWVFSALLVVVGGLQVWLLWGTLGAIRRQAEQMERQTERLSESISVARDGAKAALLNAQAVINSERPWMLIELTPIPGVPWTGFINFRAWNRGRTPAEITDYQSDFFFHGIDEDFAPEPTFRPLERLYREYISPGNSLSIYGFDLNGSMPPDQWQWMTKEKKRLYFKGRILYRDMITHEEHESRFCYWLSPAEGVGLLMGGERDWNKYT